MNRWLLLPLAIAIASFGASALLDRYLRRNVLKYSQDNRRLLRRLQKATAATGLVAAVAIFYALFGKVLGTFIS